MLNHTMSKEEIEKELRSKGDFVQIDHLTRFLKEDLSINMKKFVYQKLAEIYEKKNLWAQAAKMYDGLAVNSVAFSEKIKNYVKETELYIKAGFFDRADEAMKKAMNHANANEKAEIYFTIKEFYKRQAMVYEKELRRAHAIKIYEKLLEMDISDGEREEIKIRLMKLYEKTGNLQKYFGFKREL